MEDIANLFEKIGLSESKAKETAANKKLAPTLELVIKSVFEVDVGKCSRWN
jgi:glutaminyl-tRNA synthetase